MRQKGKAYEIDPGFSIWFAYDEPRDWEPLIEAARLLTRFHSHEARCFVLIGYEGDTIAAAQERLNAVVGLGLMPQAMLYNRRPEKEWRRFQREWANAVIVGSKMARARMPAGS